jgi:hypothetical protein
MGFERGRGPGYEKSGMGAGGRLAQIGSAPGGPAKPEPEDSGRPDEPERPDEDSPPELDPYRRYLRDLRRRMDELREQLDRAREDTPGDGA